MSDPDPLRALKRYRVRIELPLRGPVEAAMTESALGEWVRFDELASVLAVLTQPQTEENKEDQSRVAPLTAGDDGQDLPRRSSGEKSPL